MVGFWLKEVDLTGALSNNDYSALPKLFVDGRTDGRTYGRTYTDGRTFPPLMLLKMTKIHNQA